MTEGLLEVRDPVSSAADKKRMGTIRSYFGIPYSPKL